MHKELLAQSPLLVFPILAQLVFLGVFVSTTYRAMTQSKREIDAASSLPLSED
jgi:hypothetical protein